MSDRHARGGPPGDPPDPLATLLSSSIAPAVDRLRAASVADLEHVVLLGSILRDIMSYGSMLLNHPRYQSLGFSLSDTAFSSFVSSFPNHFMNNIPPPSNMPSIDSLPTRFDSLEERLSERISNLEARLPA